MSIKASASVTLSSYRDTEAVTRYYKLVSSTASAPSKPTTNPPSGWDDTEPSYTSGSTNTLYFCDLTKFSDGTWAYSAVSKSSSYEAAKEAYNKAQNAQDTANSANGKIDGLKIGGRNLIKNSNFSLTYFYWNDWGCPSIREYVTSDNKKWCHIKGTGTDRWQGVSQHTGIQVEKNTKYTFSARVKGASENQKFTVGIHWCNLSGSILSQSWKTFFVSTTEQVVSVTFTAPSVDLSRFNIMLGVDDASVVYEVYFTDLKLEKGNKATDWTPAPEDMVDKANIVSCINQTPESITIQANKISLEGLITANSNFKILSDGSMETIAGKIGGWSIDENSLSSHKDSVSITEPEGSSEYYTLVGDVSMKVNSDALCIESTFNYVSTPCDAIEDAGITKGIRSIEINSAKNTVELTNKETYNEFFPDDVPVILKAVLSPDDLEFTITDTSGTDKFSVKELFGHFRSKNLSNIYVYSGRVSFLNSSYYNNTTTYGRTIKLGASDMGYFIDDTYWLSVDYTGKLALGVQINGAKYPTWSLK